MEWFDVGEIVNTHGVRGEVRVRRITDFEERFAVGATLYLFKQNDPPIQLEVSSHRKHKQFDLLRFTNYETLNDVEPLKGAYLKIKKEQMTPLPEGEYYHYEIIGCEMYTVEGEKLGVVTAILAPGANDVWVIRLDNNKEAYIPYIKDVVKDVDVENKRITIELMEGLLE
ncbi:MAG TPA: ribosome maturation factor RimM [Bacillota bacterium]|nr:ribosome maturation factor RimM [Bacillota bacterium]